MLDYETDAKVYCEMLPCTQKIADLKWKPKGGSSS